MPQTAMRPMRLMRSATTVAAAMAFSAVGLTMAQAQDGRTTCYPGTPDAPLEDTVIVNTTGGTITDALQEAFWDDFEKECGVRVERFDMTARTFTQLQQFAGQTTAPFDMGNTYLPEEFQQGVDAGLFYKLPQGFFDDVKDELLPGSYNEYGVWAYVVVRLMITNTEMLPDGLPDWAAFFDGKAFPGPRAIQDIPRTAITVALLAKGYKADEIYPMSVEKMDEAFEVLDRLKPYIRTLTTKSDQPVQGVAAGDFAASYANTARTIPAIEDGLPVAINWDAGGDVLNYYFYVIKNAAHPRAAMALIHYQQDAKRQARFFELFGYSASNAKVTDFLSPKDVDEVNNAVKLFTDTAEAQNWWVVNNAEVMKRWEAWKAAGGFGG
ncbi:MAG: extracellular solute-binding protein [Paracoccus sp. (in: a-proteobacteria)]|uniref:ABC transporter substrate-binding protein n=1 Tax=Paracoccus sp. TaxID=267 RepID=UPI0039E4064D